MIYIGDKKVKACYLGDVPIGKVYLGDELLFNSKNTYTITASIDPAGSGAVTGAGRYQEGASVTLTAAPGEDYKFVAWTENGETVSEDAEYTFTATADRDLVAVFAAVPASRLPEGYTEVEYISNPNLGYISDIGLDGKTKPLSGKKIEIKIKLNNTNGNQYIFGSSLGFRRSSSATLTFSYYYTHYNGLGKITTYYNSGNASVDISTILNETLNMTIDYESLTFTINNQEPVTMSSPGSLIYAIPMGLFCYHYKQHLNTIVQSDEYRGLTDFTFYSMKISSGGEVLNEWVPCINPDGLVGIYDIINDVFESSGDAAKPLVAGPAV